MAFYPFANAEEVMSCNDGLFAHWSGVPAGSRLEVKVEGDENEFIAFGSVQSNGGGAMPVQKLEHSDLHPGPHHFSLSAGATQVIYTVSVRFTVTGSGSAAIRGRVVLSNGQVFDQPFCQAFSGTHGTTFGCSIGASL